MELGRSRGVRVERTEHTTLFSRTLGGFGLTGRQKVHFSTFHGKIDVLEMALKTFNFVQGLHITPLLYFLRYFKASFNKKLSLGNRISRNLKMSKFGKDARRKIIEICLVKSASTSVVC